LLGALTWCKNPQTLGGHLAQLLRTRLIIGER
jgi:hypothetical protein